MTVTYDNYHVENCLVQEIAILYWTKTRKAHATNSIKAIPEEHWENPDAVKQMEGFHEAILVKIWNDVNPAGVVSKLKATEIKIDWTKSKDKNVNRN